MQEHTFHYNNEFQLESGEMLPSFSLRYCTFGKINKDRSNIVWVCHALTGNSNVSAWWGGLFGENCLFNPEEHYVICVNVIGSCYGSTGPLSINPNTGKPYFHTFPKITIRDIVATLEILRVHLKIEKIHTLTGGSLGGQQALEWAVTHPDLFDNMILMSSNAKHSPWGIAFNETQRMAISADPTWHNDHPDAGNEGMKAARAIAMLSYRNYETYEKTQFEETNDLQETYRASSYQRYQGEKLAKRFNAFSYWVLSDAMDTHNIARGRGSIMNALSQIKAYTQVIGITTDILFPIPEQRLIVRGIRNVTYEEINSTYGHDGFLVEMNQLDKSIRTFYKQKEKKQLIHG
ncbi:homoserine O-acetyltransferase MetX [Chondrinema litorale]|uniref:homoserine O-acetyltransferase MetX n=1 Tax=Chondrinema litorale TaxID=2994555 RepID=UPI00254271CF|nr:homoserine O-acetyltransferase [Chondrinema litorale]UZR96229.1 homoserine O-acetyltransferase [Chondrinema litorale]